MTWKNSKNRVSTSFHDIFDFAPVGILSFDQKWIITAVNESFFEFGIVNTEEKENLIGSIILDQNLFEGISLNQYLKQIAAGIPFEAQVKSQKKLNGNKLSIILKGAPISDDDEFRGGILVIEDIQINIDDDNGKIVQPEYFNQIFDNFSDYYFLADTKGKVILHSNSDNNIYLPLFSKFNENINELFAYTESMALKNTFDTALNYSRNEQITIPLLLDSQEHFFNFQFQPVTDSRSNVKYVAILITNKTTEIKEKIRLESEINGLRKYHLITSAIVDAVINIDLQGKINYWNASAAELFNLSESEVMYEPISKVIPTIDEQYFANIKDTLFERSEERRVGKECRSRWSPYH